MTGKQSGSGRPGRNNRPFVDAVLWVARTGPIWPELPEQFGDWNSVFRALAGDPDFGYVMIDSTIVRAPQHSAGVKGGGGSRDGSPWPFKGRAGMYSGESVVPQFLKELYEGQDLSPFYHFKPVIQYAVSMLFKINYFNYKII